MVCIIRMEEWRSDDLMDDLEAHVVNKKLSHCVLCHHPGKRAAMSHVKLRCQIFLVIKFASFYGIIIIFIIKYYAVEDIRIYY